MTNPAPKTTLAHARPLSPHLQVWRWTLSMALSILHRATGMALSIGLLVVVWWLTAAATGPGEYETFQNFVSSTLGQFMLFGWLFALYLHIATGIRHLVMDTGAWLSIKATDKAGGTLVLAAVLLTAATWARLKGWI